MWTFNYLPSANVLGLFNSFNLLTSNFGYEVTLSVLWWVRGGCSSVVGYSNIDCRF